MHIFSFRWLFWTSEVCITRPPKCAAAAPTSFLASSKVSSKPTVPPPPLPFPLTGFLESLKICKVRKNWSTFFLPVKIWKVGENWSAFFLLVKILNVSKNWSMFFLPVKIWKVWENWSTLFLPVKIWKVLENWSTFFLPSFCLAFLAVVLDWKNSLEFWRENPVQTAHPFSILLLVSW